MGRAEEFSIENLISTGRVHAETSCGLEDERLHLTRASASVERMAIVSADLEYSTVVQIGYVGVEAVVRAAAGEGPGLHVPQVEIREFEIDGHRLDITFQRDGPDRPPYGVQLRWRDDPHPRSSIDGKAVAIRNFGRVYFGEITEREDSWSFTAVRMELGSPVEGSLQFAEVEVGLRTGVDRSAYTGSESPEESAGAEFERTSGFDRDMALARDIRVRKPLEFGAAAEVEEAVQLTAYYPKRMAAGLWNPLLAYAHTAAGIARVREHSGRLLGADLSSFASPTADALSKVRRGTTITVVPEIPECQVNPRSVSFEWLEDMHAVEFRVKPETEAIAGRVAYYVGPILIGDVAVVSEVGDAAAVPLPDVSNTARQYQSVFVCYSHKDEGIAKLVELFYPLTGIATLRDAVLLRSGEEWSPALFKAIENADIFQLMWSASASASKHVREEIEHALALGRKHFIRPMYWEKPMPSPPSELNPMHFVRLDLRHLVFALSEQDDPELKKLAKRLLD
jgi:hypothetical protein